MNTFTEEKIKEFDAICTELKGVGTDIKELKALPELLKSEQKRNDALDAEVKKLTKQFLSVKNQRSALKSGEVTDDCARHIGVLAMGVGVKRGQITGRAAEMIEAMSKEVFGAELKAALTSSDIPLPTEFSGQVVELVGMFGTARKYGTVFPLGAGTVKLPKLGTDTTFGLIASSGTVTEKSPTVTNVTFTPEKFGGLVRLPTELDEDSIVPIGQFIARYAARQLARAEDHNFWVGTGAATGVNGTAEGFTKNVVTNSKTTTQTGLGSPSEMTLAHLRAVRAVVDASALRNGAYYFHPTFEQKLSTFNSSGDRPYNPNAQLANNGAQPFVSGPTLDGFPIRWVDVMPAYTTSDVLSTVHALFGDASFQYLGVRGGIRFDTSTEAGFTTDEILIRALERFTIGLMANGAVAGVLTAAA